MKNAIIVDLDGTLVKVGNRSYFDASTADKVDTPVPHIVDLVQRYMNGNVYVFFVTGRSTKGDGKDATYRQLSNIFPKFESMVFRNRASLHMRKDGDFRKDTLFKGEIYKNFIKGKFNVLFALEDRKQMVDLYRNELKVPCFEVEENHR